MPVLTTFGGAPVVDYVPGQPLQSPHKATYRLRTIYGDHDLEEAIESFAQQDGLENVVTLSVGCYGPIDYNDSAYAIELITAQLADKLTSLKTLYWGDMSYDEFELNWIKHGDLAPLLAALPKLETLKVRGSNDLRFTELAHARLEEFSIETHGIFEDCVEDIITANLPALRDLELYLGSREGPLISIKTLAPLLHGRSYPELSYAFPALERLALMNCCFVDAIVEQLPGAAALDQIDVLDLTMGALTMRGAQVLLDHPELAEQVKLHVTLVLEGAVDQRDLQYHDQDYLPATEDTRARLEAQGIVVLPFDYYDGAYDFYVELYE